MLVGQEYPTSPRVRQSDQCVTKSYRLILRKFYSSKRLAQPHYRCQYTPGPVLVILFHLAIAGRDGSGNSMDACLFDRNQRHHTGAGTSRQPQKGGAPTATMPAFVDEKLPNRPAN